MEDINVLKAENEKLNARLQKAITVFGEQKASITRLTEERDAANTEIQKLKERIVEFEKKEAENSEQDSKFFDQLKEIEDLKEQTNAYAQKYEALQKEYEAEGAKKDELITKLTTDRDNIQAQFEDLKSRSVEKVNALMKDVETERERNTKNKEAAQQIKNSLNSLVTNFDLFQ